ncbi:trimeric intracellular cation channel family protein, partial [Micrococcus luteus]|nr:trimeric intracellular cation channel family protein [Micrococcus luteus]
MDAPLDWIRTGLELAGVFFFATSGSLLAARRGFDLVASLILASLVGLGGGVLRDMVISQGAPSAFTSPIYLLPPVLAAGLVYFHVPRLSRLERVLVTCDAAGLALFSIVGTLAALDAGMNAVTATILGALSAVGGGVIRDVVANEVPQMFLPEGLYAVTALVGAAATTVLVSSGRFGLGAGLAVAALVFGLRMASIRHGWRAPHASAHAP